MTPLPGGGGGTFQGTEQGVGINDAGTIVFSGIIPSSAGLPGTTSGAGIFTVDRGGNVTKVVVPGDPAPSGVFDYAQNAGINQRGEVVFEAHLAGAECVGGTLDPTAQLGCNATGVYLSSAGSSTIIKIAQQADVDPSGAPFRHCWGPVINNLGQVLFVGDLTPPPDNDLSLGLYLYNGSSIAAVARPGDALTGGGTLKTVNIAIASFGLNNNGAISFPAVLDNGDQGVYVRSGVGAAQSARLVAKTGTVMPGIGTFSALGGFFEGPVINDRGQLVFSAVLTSGETVLVIATPKPQAAE